MVSFTSAVLFPDLWIYHICFALDGHIDWQLCPPTLKMTASPLSVIIYGCQSQTLNVWICHWHIDESPQLNHIHKKRDLCTVWVFYKNGFQHCCCSVFLSWRGEWRIDSSRGSDTGRRRLLMEKEQGSVASSASVTIPSTTSASTISNSSGRQQAVPQISVYGGITDRQTVQVERNLSHIHNSHKFALSSGAIYRVCAATTYIINQPWGSHSSLMWNTSVFSDVFYLNKYQILVQ